ncbi:MAG: polysaccharide biosynthesis tyrosine autokinase [wastewater metagenome]|nr:polysaccharide biosynthesis tyrosine autokinase [Candidatus Loosdrechtia aerotolerans]
MNKSNAVDKTHSYRQDDISELDEINLRDYWRIAVHRKWLIISLFSIVVLLATIYTFKQTPIFQAVSTIRIYKEAPKVLSFEEVVSSKQDTDFYNTECDILKSRSLAERVIKKLKLDQHPEFVGKDKEKDNVDETTKMKKLVDAFLKRITIEHKRNSELVNIKAETSIPTLSAVIANTLTKEYIDKNMESKVLTTRGATEEIYKQLEETKKNLKESEKRLYAYAQENDIVAMEERQGVILDKITTIAQKLTEAEADRITKEVEFLQLQNNGLSAVNLADNENLGKLELTHAELVADYSTKHIRYKEDHPILVSLKRQIGVLEEKIEKVIRTAYLEAIDKEKGLQRHLEELKRENNLLEEKSIGYRVLERDVTANTQLYEGLLQRMKEAAVSSEIKTTNIQIVDNAAVPTAPIKPNKKLNVLLSMIVGLTMGVGLAFFIEYLDNTIKGPDDVEQHLKIPLLGIVNKLEVEKGGLPDRLIVKTTPQSVVAEAIRDIRTNLIFSFSGGDTGRIIVISSTIPFEGKSFVSSNLAIAMAQAGKKVLLIDSDLRKPTLNKYFDTKREPGITNVLVAEAGLESVVHNSIVPNLSFMSCGPIPPNPSELLGSPRMEEFLRDAREKFDWIFLDSPPESSVTDSNILNNMADGSIIVVKVNTASRDHIRKTISQFNENQPKVIGVVLNMVDFKKRGYYYRYGYYSRYRYYREEEAVRTG